VKAVRRKSGFSLVELLVVVVLLVFLGGALSYFYLGRGGTDPATGKRKVTPIGKAVETKCRSNIGQIRQALQMTQSGSEDEKFPATLKELKLPSEFDSCPDGKEPYQYDPQSGQVRCQHPGHERF
jgi:prepilin-type N-terminal cleavage/methylation domain-containing protein